MTSEASLMHCSCIYTVLCAMNCRVASPHTQEHTPLGTPGAPSQPEAVRTSLDRVISRAPVPLQVSEGS